MTSAESTLTAKNGLDVLRKWLMRWVVCALTALVVFSPQLVVYKILNGNFGPAKDVTQKFTWDGVHIGDVLFSGLHGLFSWTPIVLLAVIGLFLLARKDKLVAICFIGAFLAELYLLGSFSTWFGGAGFGMRRFVNATVIFVLGLAALADFLCTRVSTRLLVVGAGAFVVWNLLLIVQFATGIIPREQPVPLAQIAYNDVFVVPTRLGNIVWRFVVDRRSFFR
jgi:hypothetical protein